MIEIEYNFISWIMFIKGIEKNHHVLTVYDYDVQSTYREKGGVQYFKTLKQMIISNGGSIVPNDEYKKILDMIEKYFILTKQEYRIEILPKRFKLNESGL